MAELKENEQDMNGNFASNSEPQSLLEFGIAILKEPNPNKKQDLTQLAASKWKSNQLKLGPSVKIIPVDIPARPDFVKIVPPNQMPPTKSGTLEGRIAILHSLVHIENVAIDLSWDMIVRFSYQNWPKEFYDEWVKIAGDESRHYSLLNQRLENLGFYYGSIPAHDGLWESAMTTSQNPMIRLAIEHMVHEGHGLDVTPKTISRFKSSGDLETAKLLEIILEDEITHVTAGQKWFTYLCNQSKPPLDPIKTFIDLVPKYFKGPLKPPFNKEARLRAGMTEDWYLPLAKK